MKTLYIFLILSFIGCTSDKFSSNEKSTSHTRKLRKKINIRFSSIDELLVNLPNDSLKAFVEVVGVDHRNKKSMIQNTDVTYSKKLKIKSNLDLSSFKLIVATLKSTNKSIVESSAVAVYNVSEQVRIDEAKKIIKNSR